MRINVIDFLEVAVYMLYSCIKCIMCDSLMLTVGLYLSLIFKAFKEENSLCCVFINRVLTMQTLCSVHTVFQ
jgi:hypothetical protein